jgi:enterochelin esterase-like enzyme
VVAAHWATGKEAQHVEKDLLRLSLVAGLVPVVAGLLAALLFVALVARRPARRWAIVNAITLASGLGLGFLIAWHLGDVRDEFDVTLTFTTRLWFAVAIAGVALAIVSLWRTRWWRAILAVVAVPVFVLVGGLGINADLGEFPTVATAVGSDRLEPLVLPTGAHGEGAASSSLWKSWDAPAFMPKKGRVGTVRIPGTISGFHARRAIVYLPPAALVRDAPALPVLIMMSGQPGSPEDLVASAQLPHLLNAYAEHHHGLAPIVVIPDQLGARSSNPMCLDSPLGHAASYITQDVPAWITAHLSVLSAPRYWGVGGFSEGGTCSIQFGAGDPTLFGSILDISGQVVPANGTVAQTIDRAFGGSVDSYRAATPEVLLKEHAPFSSTLGLFGVGEDDAKYAPQTATMFAAAKAAKMDARFIPSPGTAHDWHTVDYVVTAALPILGQHWGLTK